jgi:hypothetical protein
MSSNPAFPKVTKKSWFSKGEFRTIDSILLAREEEVVKGTNVADSQ